MSWKDSFKKKIHFKKWMILLITTILLVTSMNAAIFATLETDTEVDIHEDTEALQFMAADWNHEGERVLQRDGDRLVLDLGVWPMGESKTYPAAFAIVNPADESFTINDIELKGEPDNLRMYLHENMDKPCSEDLVNVENTEDGEMELLYDPQEEDPIHPEWELGPGPGDIGEDELEYGDFVNDDTDTAPKKDGVWTREMEGPKQAVEGVANFVWVEMAVDGREAPDPDIHRGPIEFEIEGEHVDPEPEPNIAFMASGRRDGSPTIRRLEGNTIEVSFTDLKDDTTVVVPDAFAIVNAGPTELNVDSIELETGELDPEIWLHSDPYVPAHDYSYDHIETDEEEDKERYHPEGPSEEWTLSEGFGFTGDENLIYGDPEDTAIANRTAGYPGADYNVWMYDEEAENVAEQGSSNFVWVEIGLEIEDVGDEEDSLELTFNFSSN